MKDMDIAAHTDTVHPLTDEYVNAVIQQHGYGSAEAVIARLYQWMGRHGGENSATLLIYEAHKALSKLRAPVADERAVFEAKFPLPAHCQWIGNGYAATEYNAWDAHKHSDRWESWQARAALASASVAREAQPSQVTAVAIVRHDDTDCPQLDYTLEGGLYELPDGAELVWASNPLTGDDGQGTVYAARQASEAVRIVFPTHLRKMWSGGEVQAWLDEHQGVTASKPSAKGSLERYRKWQAERDEAFAAGVKAAADLVKKMVDGYDTDHGSTDAETGAREYPGEGATWVCEMQELEESIRALSAQPGAQKHDDGGTAHG
ncbi:hypothetical protein D3C71_547070 [compost metagenome]